MYVALLGPLSGRLARCSSSRRSLLQILLTFGLGCIAATLTAFLRDTATPSAIVLTVGFYATPIVYPASLVPARLRPLIEANPVSHLVDLYRRAFTLHAAPRRRRRSPI